MATTALEIPLQQANDLLTGAEWSPAHSRELLALTSDIKSNPAGYAETLILGRVTDGLALVLEAGSTRREAAATAMENLRASNIPIVAAVLNKGAAPTSKKFFR